ncbi:MAG: hypothetical protein K2H87_06935 [Duncaniella sp.]|nr:hypothetical protein [Duncaniella sp.]
MADPMIVWYVVVSILLATIIVHSLRHLHSLRARRIAHKVEIQKPRRPRDRRS